MMLIFLMVVVWLMKVALGTIVLIILSYSTGEFFKSIVRHR